MSHSKERHEKICLNCNADLYGRYCHVCGQENIEPKETVWGLVSHFFYDITHFDGKFFSTTRYLIVRPGFLPKEYLEGRRARYLHPIRMYVFTSAVFFLFLFSTFNFREMLGGDEKRATKTLDSTSANLDVAYRSALADADNGEDSAAIEKAFAVARVPFMKKITTINIDTASKVATGTYRYKYNGKAPGENTNKAGNKTAGRDTATGVKMDTVTKLKTNVEKKEEKENARDDEEKKDKKKLNTHVTYAAYTSMQQYDSAQHALPAGKRDNWVERLFTRRSIELQNKYGKNDDELFRDLIEKFMHTFPYLLFVSLPLYALWLKMLYWRRRKQFLYVGHAVFLIYLYIFTFILLSVYFILLEAKSALDWDWITWLAGLLLLVGVYYTCRAMHKFYGQSRTKTFIKFCLLNTFAFFSLTFLFTIFILFAVFKI